MRWEYEGGAEAELIEAAQYYADRRPGLGAELIHEVVHTVRRILETPKRFAITVDDIRYLTVNRFPYSVCYWIDEETVHIVAILHHSRGPDYREYRLRHD